MASHIIILINNFS